MKKIISIILSLSLLVLYVASFAESSITGEFVPFDFGYSADLLFSKREIRAMLSGILAVNSQDEFGEKGPLSFDLAKDLISYSSWVGITDDKEDLINIGYYNDKQFLMIFVYNPREGIVRYNAIENDASTDDELIGMLPDLFAKYNVTEFYEAKSDEKIDLLESVGMSTLRRKLER